MTEPKQVGRYHIKKELGRGGMATVYLAYDPRFNRNVAVKILPSEFTHDPMFRARFEREAQTIAVLEHPAIVPVHDFGEDEGRPFLVMRFMPGGPLSNKLAKSPLSLAEAAAILRRVASALDYAHKLGIIHRDIKPGNILFDQFGNAYLADFGIAKIVEATTDLTGSAITVGTPAYMSPEQVQGEKVDSRSDVYSLGVVLFEMLSGKQPYEATTPIAVAFKHVHEPIPDIRSRNDSLPPNIQSTINKAMSKNRNGRFSTAGSLATNVTFLAEQESARQPTELLILDEELHSLSPPPAVVSEIPDSPVVETVVAVPPPNDNAPSAQPQVKQTRNFMVPSLPIWVWGIAGLFILIILAWGFSFFSDNNVPPEDTPVALTEDDPGVIVAGQATETETETPTHSPTSTSPPIQAPTHTPTVKPTDTAVPLLVELPTATDCPPPQFRVTSASVNVRTGPGVSYSVQRVAFAEDIFVIVASTESGSWYNIQLGTDERGWISATVGELEAAEACDNNIPVAATIPVPPPPTATPTQVPTNTPTTPSQSSPPDNNPQPIATSTPTPIPP